jgi:orotate phosphoribosyltransferase
MYRPIPLLSTVHARRGHFHLESGHHADLWMDLETLCLRPGAIRPFAGELAGRLRRYEVDAVCGPLNEGAFVAMMVASELDCDFTYAERFAAAGRGGLFPVEYRLPPAFHSIVPGRRVAIVNDVISAGSAVRGAFAHLQTLGARIVAIGSLVVLGPSIAAFASDRGVPLEAVAELPMNVWEPSACPLCASGLPLETAGA